MNNFDEDVRRGGFGGAILTFISQKMLKPTGAK